MPTGFIRSPSLEGTVCDFGHEQEHPAFGFLVDTPEIRELIAETLRLRSEIGSDAERVEALRPAFARLLAADGWLPREYAEPDPGSGMGGGIGQYALYRAEDGSLCLFSLVVPAGASTPVHDHLAWGLVGVYRGEQAETIYRRVDDGSREGHAELEVTREHHIRTGELYTLLPPLDDIHFVTTVSQGASVSLHLLANDTACVVRHRFEPALATVSSFRSGYGNAPCPPLESETRSRDGAGLHRGHDHTHHHHHDHDHDHDRGHRRD
jgi:predicted metal-dependent enzyme (double-stranded beta helix superfamily)